VRVVRFGGTTAIRQAVDEPDLDADSRNRVLLEAMTREEKLALYSAITPAMRRGRISRNPPEDWSSRPATSVPTPGSASRRSWRRMPGSEWRANRGHIPPGTALPSNLAAAASWIPNWPYAGGRMIGNEARLSGFNVQLAGGINLAASRATAAISNMAVRIPCCGQHCCRADPWYFNPITSSRPSNITHLNDQETNRTTASVRIDERSARMSDLLAFELAIAMSSPDAVIARITASTGSTAVRARGCSMRC